MEVARRLWTLTCLLVALQTVNKQITLTEFVAIKAASNGPHAHVPHALVNAPVNGDADDIVLFYNIFVGPETNNSLDIVRERRYPKHHWRRS